MQLKLILKNKVSQKVSESVIAVEEKVVIGRHLGSPLLLEGDAISRQHFSIGLKDGQPAAENLSSNGTMLNGIPLQGEDALPLVTGDMLEIPGYEIRVEVQNGVEEGGARREGGLEKDLPVWNRVIRMAVGFFDPLEIMLVMCVIATIVLITYYLTS